MYSFLLLACIILPNRCVLATDPYTLTRGRHSFFLVGLEVFNGEKVVLFGNGILSGWNWVHMALEV